MLPAWQRTGSWAATSDPGPRHHVFNYLQIQKSQFTVQNGPIILTSGTAGTCLKHFLPSIIASIAALLPSALFLDFLPTYVHLCRIAALVGGRLHDFIKVAVFVPDRRFTPIRNHAASAE